MKSITDWAEDVSQYDIPGIAKLAQAVVLIGDAIEEGFPGTGGPWCEATDAMRSIKELIEDEIDTCLEFEEFTI